MAVMLAGRNNLPDTPTCCDLVLGTQRQWNEINLASKDPKELPHVTGCCMYAGCQVLCPGSQPRVGGEDLEGQQRQPGQGQQGVLQPAEGQGQAAGQRSQGGGARAPD